MKWKEFDPANGKLRAEGTGDLFTSRIVRSMGLCLEYARTDRVIRFNSNSRAARSEGDLLLNSYLPVVGVSDLIFGVVPGNKRLGCWDRPIGTIDEIIDFLDFLDNTGAENLRLTRNLRRAMNGKAGWIPGFNDIIPLTAAKMSSSASLLCNIPMPNTYSPGLLRTCEGLQVFCQRLRGYVADERQNASAQLHQVLAWVDKLEAYHQWNAKEFAWAYAPLAEWISPEKAYNDAREYRCEIHRVLDDAEAFLVSINEDPHGSIRTDRKEQKSGFC